MGLERDDGFWHLVGLLAVYFIGGFTFGFLVAFAIWG